MRHRVFPFLFFLFLLFTLSTLADGDNGNAFNVKTFGASGDGTNLDSPSINKTIDACAQAIKLMELTLSTNS